jgi:uncharacterized protein YijF (DUF1287 family)
MIDRREFVLGAVAFGAAACWRAGKVAADTPDWSTRLVDAAARQLGETILYDPAYVRLDYPGGDVPRDRGVCTDVIIRAYRDGLGLDLQVLVHEDMKRNFAAYPQLWGMAGPDRNIDHRRVPNLRTFLRRKGAELGPSAEASDFKPGDLVSQTLPGNLAHIVMVSDVMAEDGAAPMVIHNIGAGARRENRLFEFKITGRYRFAGT